MFIKFIIFVLFFTLPDLVFAQNQPHFTLIINQVRGEECCDVGSLANLQHQLEKLNSLNLSANFALRYDILSNSQYLDIFKGQKNHQLGSLLEIIPSLASDSGVNYKGDNNSWYEAQNVFLIGYTNEERKKLIDTYMQKFHETFASYPQFTSAWMIDNWSLSYLKSEYGVTVHQITREQFGTDSYTLYGGPIHYPYFPSDNWALIPDSSNIQDVPLIVRQTIMDPVFCYGDSTDSYTSQPNDYFLRNDNLAYFKHLFLQAHNQNTENYTFALVGLENSMNSQVHDEYFRQLDFIKAWQSDNNQIIRVSDLDSYIIQNQNQLFNLYYGKSQNNENEQAIWITTDKYRARIRLSNQELFISDLRIYDQNFTDPYSKSPAGSLGWWIIPFALDGSRYFYENYSGSFSATRNDYLLDRKPTYFSPVRITLAQGLDYLNLNIVKNNQDISILDKDKLLIKLTHSNIFLPNYDIKYKSESLDNIIKDLIYYSKNKPAWGFTNSEGNLTPFAYSEYLPLERTNNPKLLFPEIKFDPINKDKTILHINNAYAIAGRNPIRLVLFPKDNDGNSVLTEQVPEVKTDQPIDEISINRPYGSNGMIFIDLNNPKPLKIKVSIQQQDFNQDQVVYFAPNCKQDILYCLTHPKQASWFIRSYLQDKQRQKQELINQQENFIN